MPMSVQLTPARAAGLTEAQLLDELWRNLEKFRDPWVVENAPFERAGIAQNLRMLLDEIKSRGLVVTSRADYYHTRILRVKDTVEMERRNGRIDILTGPQLCEHIYFRLVDAASRVMACGDKKQVDRYIATTTFLLERWGVVEVNDMERKLVFKENK